MKTCPKCKVEKPLIEFRKDTRKNGGVGSYCKPCSCELGRKYKAKRIAKDPEKFKRDAVARERKRLYGITQEQFENMVQNQNGKCAICDEILDLRKNTCVDHCHKTGINRDILCAKCNFGLGQFKDSVELLESAIEYLKKHQK